MPNFQKLLLRWSFGVQDTTRLADFSEDKKLYDLFWLTKLSVISFQRWFPGAKFMIFYNGDNFFQFCEIFESIELSLFEEIEYVNQAELVQSGELPNPYHFTPQGVWWKWVPFRYDISKHEVSIDTDIVCIGEPKDWYKWLDSTEEILIAPERFKNIVVSTCGDFYSHPVLRGKTPLNCGIVGHRAGCDFSERFFDITEQIEYGYTRNSLFITEQGAINVWVYSLEIEGISSYVLDFERCAWIRDFLYYFEKGVPVETIHATTWHKRIARSLGSILERRVFDESYDDCSFLSDMLVRAKELNYYQKHVLKRQIGESQDIPEFFA